MVREAVTLGVIVLLSQKQRRCESGRASVCAYTHSTEKGEMPHAHYLKCLSVQEISVFL